MTAPLKIAIPIHSLDPGGVERVALGLATQWRDAGHDVTVVLGRGRVTGLCSAPALDYWQIPTGLPVASGETAWMVHCLYSYLVEHRVDVLFCPGNTYAVVAGAMRVLLGEHAPPMVLKVSNALERHDMGPLMKRGYAAWLRLQAGVFDRIVALSEPMAAEIRSLMRAEPGQVATIANPIMTRRRLLRLGRLAPRQKSPWATAYLTAGRLVPQKNHAMMLRAFARAARPGDTLTIAGEGPARAELDALASQLGIAAQVRFVGHLAAIDPLFETADAFILSSDYEGLPGAVVEALAAGLPVLATDCCVSMAGLVDQGRAGLLVPPGDEAAFAAGLVEIRDHATDPTRARAIARTFEVEAAAERYITLMSDLRRAREREARRRLDMHAQFARAPEHGLR